MSVKFNRILESAVPKVEPARKTVGEMLSTTDDRILSAMRKATYSARTPLQRIIRFEELAYEGKTDGYWLSFFDDAKEEFLVFWMARHVGGAEYNFECPICQRQSKARILKRRGTVENISCATCGFVVIERVHRSRQKLTEVVRERRVH